MQKPLKHHHLPVFYLSRWSDIDGQLCQYSKPHKEILPLRRHPSQTGHVERLYELKGMPEDDAQSIETDFMQPLDTQAADALRMLEKNDPRVTLESGPRSAWSRFIMSLMMRTPEDIAALKSGISKAWDDSMPSLEEKYAIQRTEDDPKSLQEFLSQSDPYKIDRWAISLATQLIDHKNIGQLINDMHWFIVSVPPEAGEFITSDRPVITTATLTEKNAYLFLPISPQALFVAVNDKETQKIIEQKLPHERVNMMNQMVAGRAVKFVYSKNDTYLDFIKTHMGTRQTRTLIERLVDARKLKTD